MVTKGKSVKWMVLVVALLFSATLIAGCGGGQSTTNGGTGEQSTPGTTPPEKIVLRFPGTLPIGHHITEAQNMFKELVEQRTNGQVEIQVFPAQQLYTDKDLVDVVPQGGVEMASANTGMWSGLVPEVGLFDLFLFFGDRDHFYRAQDDEQIRATVAKGLEEKANTKFLAWLDYGEGGPLLRKEVKTAADFEGLKVRAHSEYSSYFLETMGAASTVLSSGEVYQALQRGTLDGAISGPTSYLDRKWYEVAKYPIKSYFGQGVFAILMNLDTWNKLPQDIQEVIQQAAVEVQDWSRDECKKADEAAWQELEAMPDVHVVTIADDEIARWREKVVPYQKQTYLERAGDTGRQLLERAEALR